jgi:hypothetical protein
MNVMKNMAVAVLTFTASDVHAIIHTNAPERLYFN